MERPHSGTASLAIILSTNYSSGSLGHDLKLLRYRLQLSQAELQAAAIQCNDETDRVYKEQIETLDRRSRNLKKWVADATRGYHGVGSLVEESSGLVNRRHSKYKGESASTMSVAVAIGLGR